MAKASKASRKHGRNKTECAAYKARGQREINKCVKLARVLLRNPNDTKANTALVSRFAYWVHARHACKVIGASRVAARLADSYR